MHSYTLDAGVGEFRLTHENLRMPERGAIYSANEANYPRWCTGVQRYIDALKDPDGPSTYSARYVGSLVADFHRTLLYGGLFLYPADPATRPTASCGCSMKRRRWPASPRRPAAAPAPAARTC